MSNTETNPQAAATAEAKQAPPRLPPDPAIIEMQLRRKEIEMTDPARAAAAAEIGAFELAEREALKMASSSVLPLAFRRFNDDNVENPDAVANCMIAIEFARRLGMAPLAVIQNMHVIHGRPGLSSQFLIGTVNACGRFTPLRWQQVGTKGKDDYGYVAYATAKADGERCEGVAVTWEMVKAEGWDKKTGSKWRTISEQMFRYRAASFWVRLYAPELAMGLRAADELEDMGPGSMRRGPSLTPVAAKLLEAKLMDAPADIQDRTPPKPPSAPQTSPAPSDEAKAQPTAEAAAKGEGGPPRAKRGVTDPQATPTDKAKVQQQAKAAGEAADKRDAKAARDGSDGSVAPDQEPPPGAGDAWEPPT